MKKVLVFGFYKEIPNSYYYGNLGDQFFIEAFRHIFPNHHFIFTDQFTIQLLQEVDTVFLGGGSFLDSEPLCSPEVLELLKTKTIFYLGIGAETNIHPWHQTLLKQAKLIVTRSIHHEKLKILNSQVIYCPDLVYALSNLVILEPKVPKSVLVFPNAYLISKWDSPVWKHNAWEHFKSEFSQFLDVLIEQEYQIDFFPLSQTEEVLDYYAAVEIMGKMKYASNNLFRITRTTFTDLTKFISSYEMIISQRYHGTVLAEIINAPCLNLWHHDKLKHFSGHHIKTLPYYSISKDLLLNEFDDLQFIHKVHPDPVAINMNIFKELKSKVEASL